jgi:peptide/nickel transport system permease protein
LIWSRFLNSLLLAVAAILFATIPALVISMLHAHTRSRALGRLIDAVVLLLSSTPRIVLALAVLAVSVSVAGIPSLTGGGPAAIIPAALVLAAPLFAMFLAQAIEGLGDAMQQDFTYLARAKGLSEGYVILRHALPAALNPLLTLLGLAIGGLLGGSVIVETVLGWPGIGSLTVFAVRSRDITLLLGIVVLTSIAVWFGNALAEFLHGVVDKRVRGADER